MFNTKKNQARGTKRFSAFTYYKVQIEILFRTIEFRFLNLLNNLFPSKK